MKKEIYSLKELVAFNIKYYRYVNNLSQEKLAEKCSLSSRYLTDVERGKHSPTFDKLELIAKALDIEPYVLLQKIKPNKNILKRMNNSRQYNQR